MYLRSLEGWGTLKNSSMRQQKLFRAPYLYDAGGDLSKSWWIELGYRDPRDGKMKRKRYQEGFAEILTKKARYVEKTVKLTT